MTPQQNTERNTEANTAKKSLDRTSLKSRQRQQQRKQQRVWLVGRRCLDPLPASLNTQQSNIVVGGLDGETVQNTTINQHERKWGDGADTTIHIHQFQIASLKHIIIITAIK